MAQLIKDSDPDLDRIDVVEHLSDSIPLGLVLTNEQGQEVKIEQFFRKGKPVILTLAYYRCPRLCTLVLNGLLKGVQQLDWKPGEKYQMLTVSIDTTETAETAAAKKRTYVGQIDNYNIESGWQFTVARQDAISQLARAVGFKYFFDQERNEFAHPAVVFVLTEEGVISRYLYGLEYKPKDLKLALLEASEGKIGNTIDRLILYCFHYDPDAKGYTLFATNVMKLGGLLTVVILGLFLGIMWVREKRRNSWK